MDQCGHRPTDGEPTSTGASDYTGPAPRLAGCGLEFAFLSVLL